MPKDFPATPQIIVEKIPEVTENQIMNLMKEDLEMALKRKSVGKSKEGGFDKIREKYKDAYRPWTVDLDEELTACYCEGWDLKLMAEHFGRTKGSILSRISKLGLEELYG